ncbi:hypothetical protein DAEQUDRAFT_233516 [Daedalea quercina L-15889]|uniref:RRM domain-containing protein n=1 Tax=Daedalea quercina L-15889 TaxID=1314783 RepID=A0A165QUT5_9APHY|nr:hypothetical protein DAEQUDRAFT_233516 [Daedalea quercina L-15889]
MQAHPPAARLHTYHSSKKQLLGNQVRAPPAWRNAPGSLPIGKKAGLATAVTKGSKILLSQLPIDVAENEVEILFAKTVGPVKDTFIVYNSQGNSKGMAVVTFARPGDAAVARQKYNGKIVDGSESTNGDACSGRPIKIETIRDDDETPSSAPVPGQKPLSLLDRIAGAPQSAPKAPAAQRIPAKGPTQPKVTKATPNALKTTAAQRPIFAANAKARLRTKKGPKRIQKQQQRKVVTAEQLDQEMEDYRASADAA